MAELTQVAANVKQNSGVVVPTFKTAGEAITAGMPVYEDSADGLYYKAQANSAAKAKCDGIALNSCAANQPLIIKSTGGIDLGDTLTVGETYVVSDATAGKIRPIGDLGTGDYPVILGVATTTSNMDMNLYAPGVAKA